MKTKDISTREKALEWWGNLFGKGGQIDMYSKYFPELLKEGNERLLTNEEIEEIWRKETQVEITAISTNKTKSWFNLSKEDIDVILPKSKPNQKLYTQEEVDKLLDQQAARTAAQIIESHQKQFKQFNESSFRAYISKFSDEDKEKCFEILMRNLDIQKAELINDGINLNLVFIKF